MSLRIYLLGQFTLFTGNQPLALPSRRAQSLLAYLVMTAGMTHRRERLAGLLWPEATESNARSYLRQALWRIRKALDSESTTGEDYLQVDDVSVTFDALSDYWLDVDQLMKSAQPASIDKQQEIVQLYRGELLPGFYDEWILPERDRILVAYQQKMHLLLEELLRTARWHEAVQWSEKWLQLAHAPEQAFRTLMRAYAGLDDQGMLKTTYERCRDSLKKELALEPSPETEQLYEALRHGAEARLPAQPSRPADISPRQPAFITDDSPSPIERPIFVARKTELEKLFAFLGRVMEEQGRVVFVTGETGSGKSALINEFAHHALAKYPDLLIVSGSCNMHTGIGDPYLPFRDILAMLTGDVEGRWAAGAIGTYHAKLLWNSLLMTTKIVVKNGPELINTFVHGPALVERALASDPPAEDWLSHLNDLARRKADMAILASMPQSDLFEQYSRVLRTIARRQALMLIIDDLQWADLASISLLFHLGRQLAGSRILVLGAYRSEEIALGRDGKRHPLKPIVNELQRAFGDNTINLNEAQSRDFVDSILDSEPNALGPSFRHLIYHQTHGNPLFTIELLHGMQQRGDLAQNENGQWIEGADLDWEKLPARVEAVIAERIGRLDQPLRTILRIACVEGEVFTAEVVARVLSRDAQEVLASLSADLDRQHRLVKAQSIVRRGSMLLSNYRFRHILFQRYLYNSLNEVDRVHFHEQVGTALEEMHGPSADVTPIAPQLARHFEEAQVNNKAVIYLHQAAKNALELSAYREGVALVQKALALLRSVPASPDRDRQELALQCSLAIAFQGTEGSQSAGMHQAWVKARELSSRTGETLQHCFILGELSTSQYVRAEYQDVLMLGDQALKLARESGDPLLVSMGHWYLGPALLATGKYEQAHHHFAKTISRYNPQEHHHQFVSVRVSDVGLGALAYDACCLWCLGYLDQAREQSKRAIALARDFGHAFTLADVLCYGGCLYHKMQRDPQSQLDCALELWQLIERFDPGVWHGEANCFQGDALAVLGQAEKGMDLLELGIAINQSMDMNLYLSVHFCSLAEAQARIGRINESWSTLNRAITFAEESGEFLWQVEHLRLKSQLQRQGGEETEAVMTMREAIKTARDQNARSLELRASVDLARLYEEQAEQEAACEILTPIVEWFGEELESNELSAARKLLARLEANELI